MMRDMMMLVTKTKTIFALEELSLWSWCADYTLSASSRWSLLIIHCPCQMVMLLLMLLTTPYSCCHYGCDVEDCALSKCHVMVGLLRTALYPDDVMLLVVMLSSAALYPDIMLITALSMLLP